MPALWLIQILVLFGTPSASADDTVPAPGRYIVTLRDGRSNPLQVAVDHRITPDYVYRRALNGFAGPIPEAVRQRLLQDERVIRIEPDSTVQAWEATWGLDRIDQRVLPLNSVYAPPGSGSGVHAYIIDTGIRISHQEFSGRASVGFDSFGESGDDCNGHGTHVAATVGGASFGVANGASLVGVRVLDCRGSGTVSGVIAGIDWVVGHRVLPAVANLSLGGGASSSLDDAVRRMIDAGVATAVAAGNETRDACNFSPSRVGPAMTVAASDSADAKASWSNYGSCVDWFAPGVWITSAWNTSDSATNTISGTSMAAPHSAGAAALYLEKNPGATPAAVRQALWDSATKKIILKTNTSNNHLLDVHAQPTVGDLNAPVTAVTAPLNGGTVAKRSTVTLEASASDSEGPITRVEFFVDSNRVCTDQVAPFTCAWRVPGGSSRNFRLASKTFDTNGNPGFSETVVVRSR